MKVLFIDGELNTTKEVELDEFSIAGIEVEPGCLVEVQSYQQEGYMFSQRGGVDMVEIICLDGGDLNVDYYIGSLGSFVR